MPQPKPNYQRELESVLRREAGRVPTLLLHSCCAPCSSYVLEYLAEYFSITVFYYNPNIYPAAEYEHRTEELRRLIAALPAAHPVTLIAAPHGAEAFYRAAEGLEDCPEGGERCLACFRLRLEESAKLAKEGGFDYFTTTLTISPLKNAQALNEIGREMGERYDTVWLPSDFKKKNGYKRSIELSAEYDLYRQDYCGCVFSLAERDRRNAENN